MIRVDRKASEVDGDLKRISNGPLRRILLTVLCFGTYAMITKFKHKFLDEEHIITLRVYRTDNIPSVDM